MDPGNDPKGRPQKSQNHLIPLCFGSERDPKREFKTAPKINPKRILIHTYLKNLNTRAAEARDLLLMLKVPGLIPTYLKALTPGPAEGARDLLLCLRFSGSFRLI